VVILGILATSWVRLESRFAFDFFFLGTAIIWGYSISPFELKINFHLATLRING